MPTVKLVQNFNHYNEYVEAHEEDVAHITDWETVSEVELQILLRWVREQRFGSPSYTVLMIPEHPVSAVDTVRGIVEKQRQLEEKEEAKRKAARERAEATKAERKRKQFEKLKAELGE